MTTSPASQTRSSTKKPLPLAGQVALITGASGGIGSATARELARQGAIVRAMVHYNSASSRGALSFIDPAIERSLDVAAGNI